MGLQGTAALVKACPKARQQRSIRSYAGASAGGTPRLVGTHGQAAAGSSSAEPAATDAASSSAADAPAAAAAAAAAAGSSSSAAAAAAAAGSSCTELAEVATGCTDLAEVIVSEPSTWMALGSPGPNDYTNYLWRLDLMEQALLRLGLKAKVRGVGEGCMQRGSCSALSLNSAACMASHGLARPAHCLAFPHPCSAVLLRGPTLQRQGAARQWQRQRQRPAAQ